MTTAPTYAEGAACQRRRREPRGAQTATLGILMAVSASHMLNDVMQSLAPALYPVFREKMALSFFQTGIITFVFQAHGLAAPAVHRAVHRPQADERAAAGRHGVHADRPRRCSPSPTPIRCSCSRSR